MKEYKARKIETFRGKYFSTVVYEYRGHTYEVEYANGINCWCTQAWVQHRKEQAKIDELIDNPKPKSEYEGKPVDLDEIWEMLEWN